MLPRYVSVFIALTALCVASTFASLSEPPALVPKPAKAEWREGSFTLDSRSFLKYSGGPAAEQEARTLGDLLRPATGFSLSPAALPEGAMLMNGILLELNPARVTALGPEGYILTVTKGGVRIVAAAPAGLFYGGQTLRQLLPPAIYAKSQQSNVKWDIPCCTIMDKPRFAWRGFMLDYSRHFFTLDYTKHLLDAMAMQKLNVFHMHLTDDDGWRIEIKKYPKLTEVGAWRGTKCEIPNTRRGEAFERYGGFFTQDQIREIVAYAARLHINVMPEVDLPGHSLAICTAYPETQPTRASGEKSVQGHAGNAISPAKESNYQIVDDIISEMSALFPFEYVHIGGDEVNHGLWRDCPQIKDLIEREKLGGLSGAQVYFTKRLEGILAKHHKKMIGWNEIMNGQLARTTAIMAWTGAGPGFHAARQGFPVVMAPGPHCYFDMGYPSANDEPPAHWWAGQIGDEKCYSFDPLAEKGLTEDQCDKIMGVHACLWSEFITPWKSKQGWADFTTNGEVADFKAFPRLCALAEMGWTPQAERQYADFADRLGVQLRRLMQAGVTVRVSPPDAVIRKGAIQILPPFRGATVRYTLDGSDPLNSSTTAVWDGKPIQGPAAKFRARTYLDGIPGPIHVGARLEAVGRWNKGDVSGDFKARDFDLSGALDESGTWRISFRKTGGKQHLVIRGVELLVNGAVVARDSHEGGTAGKGTYRLVMSAPIPAKARVVARADMKALCGTDAPDSSGELTLDKSGSLEPEAAVSTSIGSYGEAHSPSRMTDYDRQTFFWSDRALRKGETVTITFVVPVNLSHIECVSGDPNDPTKDILVNGEMAVSQDGVTFRKVADFTYGSAKAELGPERIKAVRITATADTSAWVILQDLILN